MEKESFIPYQSLVFDPQESADRAQAFREMMQSRRSIRHFSNKPVSADIIDTILMTAASAPSGAHKQPWHFCAISDPQIKKQIRKAAEEEEYENYHGRMGDAWLKDLEKFDTNYIKEFLETAPWLIVVFKKPYDLEGQEKKKNYYVSESVGIASGFLITAIHNAGLVTLTHTPSPMNFLQDILQRPENEKPYLLLPVGYPEEGAMVPNIERKERNQVITYYTT